MCIVKVLCVCISQVDTGYTHYTGLLGVMSESLMYDRILTEGFIYLTAEHYISRILVVLVHS